MPPATRVPIAAKTGNHLATPGQCPKMTPQGLHVPIAGKVGPRWPSGLGGNGVKDTGIATYQICHLITVFASWECNAGSNSATVQYIPQLHPANMASPSLFSCTHLRLSTMPSAGHGAGPQWEVVHRSSRSLPEWNCADSGWRDELGRTASVGFDGVW